MAGDWQQNTAEEDRAPDAGFAGNVADAGMGLAWGCNHACVCGLICACVRRSGMRAKLLRSWRNKIGPISDPKVRIFLVLQMRTGEPQWDFGRERLNVAQKGT